MSIKSLVKQFLVERENRRYEKLLREKQTSYGEWIAGMEEAWKQELTAREIQEGCGARNAQGVEICGDKADFVLLCAGKGVLAENALKYIDCYFKENPKVQLLYGDEDVWESVRVPGEAAIGGSEGASDEAASGKAECRKAPWFKPDWSPDLLDSCFYFGSLVAVRRELFERACEKDDWEAVFERACEQDGGKAVFERTCEQDGGKAVFERACMGTGKNPAPGKVLDMEKRCIGDFSERIYRVTDFKAYRRWMFRCVELAGGYKKGCQSVGHIPRILFHGASEAEQKKFWSVEREPQKRENGMQAEETPGLVSIVIPSKDNPELLEKCLEGCRIAAGEAYEIIVVDNGSAPEKKRQIEEVLHKFEERLEKGQAHFVTYLYEPMEFNFSRMCNLGAKASRGRYYLFLNDDVELCESGCLEKMAERAGREYTGAVGMKLYYPDSVRIQHAGITNLPMGPVHKLQFAEDNERYYCGANCGNRNYLAVTAACLMVEAGKFWEAGGFSEELRVAFNDVDFCFTLYELGYQNVCRNELHAYHHESLSRGADESAEKLKRLLAEREKLYHRHPGLGGRDPYYSVFLNREGLDTKIRPAYVTAKNRPQQISGRLEKISLSGYRQDECLMVRAEDFREGRAIGYGVILGDNNACYEKKLLLQLTDRNTVRPAKRTECAQENTIFAVKILGQYRPDLAENMSDQVNVALSGYDICFGEYCAEKQKEYSLPGGRYRIGMAARNRVTGLKLVNWTNRYVEL